MFNELNEQQTAPKEEGLFSSAVSSEKTKPLVDMDPKRLNRMSMMAAVNDVDVGEAESDPSNYLASLLETKAKWEEKISLLGETELRRDAAFKQRKEELQGFVDLARNAEDEALKIGASLAAQNVALQDVDEKAKSALEVRTVNMLEDLRLTDPAAAALYEDALENPGTLDKERQRAAKNLYIQNLVESLEAEDRGTTRKVFDWVLDNIVFPLDKGTDILNLDLGAKNTNIFQSIGDASLPGQVIKESSSTLDNISMEELVALTPQIMENVKESASLFGLTNKGEAANLLRTVAVDTPSVAMSNIEQAIEIASVVPVAKGVGVTKTLISAGAKKPAANIVASAARESSEIGLEKSAAKHGMDSPEVVTEMLPSALRNEVNTTGAVPVFSEAQASYEAGEETWKEFISSNGRMKFSEDEVRNFFEIANKRSQKLFGNGVKDVQLKWEQLTDGSVVPKNETILGKQKGEGGYINKKNAENVLKKYSLSGEVFQDVTGEWFARAVLPVDEADAYTAPLNINVKTPFGQFIKSSATVSDEKLQGAAIQGGRLKEKLVATFEELSYRNYGKLSGKQKNSLNEILEQQRDTGEDWLDRSQLQKAWEAKTKSPLPEKVEAAYSDVRKSMDLEFFIRNTETYKRKSAQGYETVELPFDLGKGNGIVSRELSDIPKERIHDVTTGRNFNKDTPMTPEQWEQLKHGGYNLVKMEKAVELPDGTRSRLFIGKGSDFKVSELSQIQVPYKPGIHRMYQNKWFSKAAQVFKQPDTGSEALLSAKAYRNFASKKQADEWNATMNEARRLYNSNPEDLVALSRLFDGRGEYPTPEEFVEAIRTKKIDPSQEFETVFDGELPTKYEGSLEAMRFMDDPSETSLERLGDTTGRMYYSKRGQRLKGFDGKDAPTLSVGQTLNRSMMNASKLSGFGDVNLEATNRMLQSFSKWIDPASVMENASPQAILRFGKLKSSTPVEIKSQWNAQKAIIGRINNAPTAWDEAVEGLNRHIENVLAEAGLPGVKTANWIREASPLDAIRGFAFHVTLGMFNVAQFPLQVSTSFQAALLAPKHVKANAAQLWSSGVIMRFAARYEGGRKGFLADLIYKKPDIAKALGFEDPDDAIEMLEAFRNSGWLDVSNSHQLANSRTGQIIGKGRFGSSFEKAKKASGVFFYEPEKWNRSVAFAVAWREALSLKNGKKLSRMDGVAMKKIFDRAETYAFQMTTESRSAFQKGPISVPTQFFAYPIRMFELMIGPKLSRAQRAKLLATQLTLYGSSGFIGAELISNKIKEDKGEEFDKGTLGYVLDRGLVDTTINMLAFGHDDTDIAVGSRIGTGSFAIDLFKEMTNTSPYGDTTALQIIGGVSAQKVYDTYKSVDDLYTYTMAVNGKVGEPMSERALLNLGKNISSVNNLHKGYLAFKYKQLYSRSGTLLDSDVTTPEVVATLFGIGTGTMENTGRQIEYMKDFNDQVNETAKMVMSLRSEAFNRPDKAFENYESISTLQKVIDDPYMWYKIMKRVERLSGEESLEKSVAKRFEQEKAFIEMSKRLKEGNE